MRKSFLLLCLAATIASCTATQPRDVAVISVVGTNDSHGELVAQGDLAGLTTFSGYVAALRDARAADGAVLLVSAGDMWQGTLESNLSEGAAVVEAYNAMGYAAAAIGNHEFDFGPVGSAAIPETTDDDPQGALRRNAGNASFPLLGANLVDAESGQRVSWNNVAASTMTTRAGIDIGIIGLLTSATKSTTIAANVENIDITPLAPAVVAEARQLRAAGADLVIVVAHAGSECTAFDDPYDLSSCDLGGEIMRVASAIPDGLVDHIVAGHRHRGIAHVVNGIAITAGYSNTRAFGRVDFVVDRQTGQVLERTVFSPQYMCTGDDIADCRYEERPVVPMPEVGRIAAEAHARATERRAEPLGVVLDTAIEQKTRPEDALGNLFTTAILEMSDADVAIHNVWGGIRAALPAGELTFGDVFRMFPFDNRVAVITLSGAELRKVIAAQAHNRHRAAGFAGMRAYVACHEGALTVRMVRDDGTEIGDRDTLRVVANDFLLLGGDAVLTPVTPDGGFVMPHGTPLVRDTLADWFRQRGGRLGADDFIDAAKPRWNLPDHLPADCELSGG